ncbi:MAG TPA: glycosyltransferase [Terriglobales bacterium]|nr:glycosyltransferase [Terriglobales bacterium]
MVSIIVPARNEQASLGDCLDSLTKQAGLTFEIIVVDDHSTDRTHEIATSFSKVRVTEAPELPHGWTGKNNAVAAGAKVARGAWLLFTDADTVHQPGSLSRSVTEAQQNKAALLSYSPEQEVHGVLEKAVMPVIFAELAATYPPSLVSNAGSPAAAANGQYLLITREAYDAVGGHAAIADNLLEDVALARNVKKSGRRICFRYGADAVRTRMYRSFSQLQEGWTKNLVLLFSSPVRLAVLRFLEFLLVVAGIGLAASAVGSHRWQGAAFGAAIATVPYVLFLTRIRRAHFSWEADLLALFGLPLFSYLLLRSVISYRRGSVSWKGRGYGRQIQKQVSNSRRDAGAASHQGSSWSI